MKGNRKDEELLKNAMAYGDSWVMRHGMSTPGSHTIIKQDLKANLPKVKDVKYLVNIEERLVEVIVYVGFWTALFSNTNKIKTDAEEIIITYLENYDINIRVARFKKDTND